MNFIKIFLLIINSSIIFSVNIESEIKNLDEKLNIFLCCKKNEYFNITSNRCENLKTNLNVSWDLRVKLINGSVLYGNIFQDFNINISGSMCRKPEIYHWLKKNDSIDINLLNNKIRCFTPYYFKDSNKYRPVLLDCYYERTFPLFIKYDSAYIFSVTCLTITWLIYVLFRELRTNISGKILICYLSAMIASKSLMAAAHMLLNSSLNLKYPIYVVICFMHYYVFMALFLWLNVLGYDSWMLLKKSHIACDLTKNNKRFLSYSLYVWIAAAIPTGIGIWRKSSSISFLCNRLTHVESCLTVFYSEVKPISLLMFISIFIMLILNIIIFTHLTIIIYRIRYDVAVMTQRQLFLKNNAKILLRLSIVMGIPWILIILLHFIKYSAPLFQIVYLTNFIQSFCILLVLVVKENVLTLLKNRFYRIKTPSNEEI